VKSIRKADFTYFPSAENKARFGDYFSKSTWIKSGFVNDVFSYTEYAKTHRAPL
jgi:hypothetical protein